jgi:hypothetical protein
MQIFPLVEDGSSTDGIMEENHIDEKTGLGYIDRTYLNYHHKYDVIANGNVKTIVTSVEREITQVVLKYNVNMNIAYSTDGNEFDLSFVYDGELTVSAENEDVNEIKVLKYELVNTKTKEIIKIIDKESILELYISSEGYVEFHKNNVGNDKFYGENNSTLELSFIEEKSIYENSEEIYTAKEAQGNINILINGDKVDKLFYRPYQILKKEVPKLSKKDLLKFSLDSWHSSYRLLHKDSNESNVTIEWFLDGKKINTRREVELLQVEYSSNNEISVKITVDNGESSTVREEIIESNYNKHDYFDSSNLQSEYDVIYRINELIVNFDLLGHEFFRNIDINNSIFSWKVDSDISASDNLIITEGTENKQVPTVTFKEHNSYSQNIYLKLFVNHEVKIVKFYIQFKYGEDGYGGKKDIIESISEANISNASTRGFTWQVTHKDLDNNGLEDILYTTHMYENYPTGYYLNVSYQYPNKKFIAAEPYLITKEYINWFTFIKTGDFNGDGISDIFIPALVSDENKSMSKIISLEQNNFMLLKEFNNTSLDILSIADMNNDGKDDFIAYDKSSSQNIIYTDINNLDEKIILTEGNNTFDNKIYITDINSDGLKDIVYAINVDKVSDVYDIGLDDMLVVKCLYQVRKDKFVMKEKVHRFSYFAYKYSSLDINDKIMIDNNILVLDTKNNEDNNKILYSFNLNQEFKLELLSKVFINRRGYDESFYPPIDMNNDGKKDLVSYSTASNGQGSVDILFQKENYKFTPNYTYALSLKEEVNSFANNSILTDIDGDGKVEITTVSAVNKFSFIEFK